MGFTVESLKVEKDEYKDMRSGKMLAITCLMFFIITTSDEHILLALGRCTCRCYQHRMMFKEMGAIDFFSTGWFVAPFQTMR